MLQITAFRWVPQFAQGYVKDLRVRWACKEANLAYTLRFITGEDQKSEVYRREQPFGQVPVLHDGDLSLFESGSILLHLGEKSEALLPKDPTAKARARTWVMAALNSVEPFVANLVEVDVFAANESWAKGRRPAVIASLKKRLDGLNQWMKNREYLEDQFTVADIVMCTVLRDLNDDVLAEYPILMKYRERCMDRPAFKNAHAEQLKNFADHSN